MAQFLKVKTAEEVLEMIAGVPGLDCESIGIMEACGRVLAGPLVAPEPVPHFQRATMDGFAVRARDTFGATESLPALLQLAGEVRMGRRVAMELAPGTAVAIPTGGMLPATADAVVMVEYTQALDDRTIEVIKPVAPGDNVLQVGEDLAPGRTLFARGWQLRPQDLGVLAALGVGSVSVYRQPRVAVLSTGDEIVPWETGLLPPGKIRDINSVVISGQVVQASARLGRVAVLADDLTELTAACRQAFEDHDLVLLSGGSSVGIRDYTPQVLEQLPEAQLRGHGVAIRPGKPTNLARVGTKFFCGLPGQPTSAMIVFTAFVRPLLARMQGLDAGSAPARATVRAVLERRLPSVHGRADYVRVALRNADGRRLASPVFGKSAMISTLMEADGYVIVPEHVEGYEAGEALTVYLFGAA